MAQLPSLILRSGSTPSGDPKFFDFVGVSDPGVDKTLIDIIVPVGKTRSLHQLMVRCKMEGRFRVTIDGTVIGSGWTGAAQSNSFFSWFPARQIETGKNIKVIFRVRPGPPAVELDAFLQTTDA